MVLLFIAVHIVFDKVWYTLASSKNSGCYKNNWDVLNEIFRSNAWWQNLNIFTLSHFRTYQTATISILDTLHT